MWIRTIQSSTSWNIDVSIHMEIDLMVKVEPCEHICTAVPLMFQ